MLPTVNSEVDLRISKILGLVVGEQEDSAISHALTSMASMAPLLLTLEEVLVEFDAGDNLARLCQLL